MIPWRRERTPLLEQLKAHWAGSRHCARFHAVEPDVDEKRVGGQALWLRLSTVWVRLSKAACNLSPDLVVVEVHHDVCHVRIIRDVIRLGSKTPKHVFCPVV